MNQCFIDDFDTVLNSSDSNSVIIKNCNFGENGGPIFSQVLLIDGGSLVMDNNRITFNGTKFACDFSRLNSRIISSTIFSSQSNDGAIRNSMGSFIYLFMTKIASGNGIGDGLLCRNSQFEIESCNISNFFNGFSIDANSKGVISTLNGNNITYGISLLGGSSFSNKGGNTITGTTSELLLGSLGNTNWGLVNGGLGVDTNDYNTGTPQYVYISP